MNKGFSNAILSVRNLRAGYHGVPILHDVNLEIEEGSCVGVLGHNGMGKSTFLRALMGYIPLFGGSIHLDETDISDLEPWRRARMGIGYLPQGRGIFVNLSVRENLCMAFNPDTSDSNENVAVERAVTRFPILESLLRNPGGTLSGGEQQILALARALIAEPICFYLMSQQKEYNLRLSRKLPKFSQTFVKKPDSRYCSWSRIQTSFTR